MPKIVNGTVFLTAIYHYLFITLSLQTFLDLDSAVPPGYERLGNRLIVSSSWLSEVQGKCDGKGKSNFFTKLFDGFFVPADLAFFNYTRCKDNEIVAALICK